MMPERNVLAWADRGWQKLKESYRNIHAAFKP